ncbi:helix-turn-helix domain-containing protein, partial [Neobacillus vireti]|uniref:helix-turn-helix domain-containing protein n=1 Tax=Neobacillus vireti TaxID=220686 RepID=UPI00300034CB
DDLLLVRGLKPKLGGSGRRGGFEMKQREQVLKSLSILQSLWIDLQEAVIYEKGKAKKIELQGPAFIFTDIDIENQLSKKKFKFTIGDVFEKYMYGSSRQVALLPIQALKYSTHQEIVEKRLIRYLSWRWRTQARKGDFLKPYKISTLLEAIGQTINMRTPSRTRDRLEQAFDRLFEDGVISSWHYEKWDESIALTKGWIRLWAETTVLIEPPDTIREHYKAIERNQKMKGNDEKNTVSYENPEYLGGLGEQIRDIRKKMGLSILQTAEQLEISAAYLSNIERNVQVPSIKIQKRLLHWLEHNSF